MVWGRDFLYFPWGRTGGNQGGSHCSPCSWSFWSVSFLLSNKTPVDPGFQEGTSIGLPSPKMASILWCHEGTKSVISLEYKSRFRPFSTQTRFRTCTYWGSLLQSALLLCFWKGVTGHFHLPFINKSGSLIQSGVRVKVISCFVFFFRPSLWFFYIVLEF